MDTTYVPVVIGAVLTPNPAMAGKTVMISVAAEDIACVPSTAVWPAGQFVSGEV